MKKKSIKMIAVLMAVLLLVFTIAPLDVSAAFDKSVRDGVVVVATYVVDTNDDIYAGGQGTGFFIGKLDENPEYLITNHHVIKEWLNYGKGEKFVVDGYVLHASVRVYYSSDDYEEARVVDYDESADIAVLRLAEPTDKRKALALHIPTDDNIGDPVYCVGFPGVSDNVWFESTSKWGKQDASVTTGTASRILTLVGKGVKAIQTDAQINH